MNPAALDSYGASPLTLVVALLASLAIGVVLLMLVVRWVEGFTLSLWASIKLTLMAVVAAMICEVTIFTLIVLLGYTGMGAYWGALALTTVLTAIVYTVIYAYGVRRPTGEKIGMLRAIKVTMVQLALSFGVIFVIAVVVALLIVNGVVKLPELTQGIL